MLQRHCAAILRPNEDGKEEWHIISYPTIGDIRSLRRKGAVIMHLRVERHGDQIERTWVSDSGIAVVVSSHPIRRDP